MPGSHASTTTIPACRLAGLKWWKTCWTTRPPCWYGRRWAADRSLPYLEQEAFGKIDPRFRFYGFVNDSEFIRRSARSGASRCSGSSSKCRAGRCRPSLNEDEDARPSFNELRGVGKRVWIGLREFTQNRYPALGNRSRITSPAGLNEWPTANQVTDLIEECCSRDIHGNALHARWVECPDREHQCYLMDRNNPAWREYLKAIIRIQIDAGVDGVQLDEAELPMTSLQYGGCFCKDCMSPIPPVSPGAAAAESCLARTGGRGPGKFSLRRMAARAGL
jgi:hypothetical protein